MPDGLTENLTIPIDAECLVPHRRPVCLIDRLVKYDERSGVCEAVIREKNPLIDDDGMLDPVAYVELIAQTYAAFKGYHDRIHKIPVRKGFLVSVKHMDTRGEACLGDSLQITVETMSEVGDFAVARGIVTLRGEVLASGSLTLWIP